MANIKSQKKRILTNERNRQANVAFRSKMRTSIKKVKAACEKKDLALAEQLLPLAVSLIDKSVKEGIQKQNTASRPIFGRIIDQYKKFFIEISR